MSVDQSKVFVKRQSTTRDAFLGGRLQIVQPEKGFRAGSDSVLLGASVPETASRILDLGAGVGTAGLVASVWAGAAEILLVERDEATLDLARENIAANALSARMRTLRVDVTAPAPVREAAGLVPDRFDIVIANPPFFEKGRGTAAEEGSRDAARHADADELDLWLRTAAASATAKGEAIFILPANRLGDALAGFDKRFGGLKILPIAARPDAEAGRILIRGRKGSRAGLTLLAPLVLHEAKGNAFAPRAADILMGRARLDW